jgi:hypothetical protein
MPINKEELKSLSNSGLLISDPFVPNHVANPSGFVIGKPKSIGGNTRSGRESYWGSEGILCDAPSLVLHEKDGQYFVTCHEWVPGPGPGDFIKSFHTLTEAIQAVKDYYFGDPIQMNPPPPPPIISPDGKYCAKCASGIISVTSDTPWEQVEKFLASANIDNKDSIIESGFLPAGIYCSSCGALYENRNIYNMPTIHTIYLLSPGHNRQKVIVKIHQILNISLKEAMIIVDQENRTIKRSDDYWEIKSFKPICEQLANLGATVKLEILEKKYGASRDPYEVTEILFGK